MIKYLDIVSSPLFYASVVMLALLVENLAMKGPFVWSALFLGLIVLCVVLI